MTRTRWWTSSSSPGAATGHSGAVLAARRRRRAGCSATLSGRPCAGGVVRCSRRSGRSRTDVADLLDVAASIPGADLVSGGEVPAVEQRDSGDAGDYLQCLDAAHAAQGGEPRARPTAARSTVSLHQGPATRSSPCCPTWSACTASATTTTDGSASWTTTPGLTAHRGRLTALAEDGCLEVATLHIDDELAAHVVGLVGRRRLPGARRHPGDPFRPLLAGSRARDRCPAAGAGRPRHCTRWTGSVRSPPRRCSR